MNLRALFVFASSLIFFSYSPCFSMEQEFQKTSKTSIQPVVDPNHFDHKAFVKLFVPANSTEKYIQAIADCYRDLLRTKKEILHDRSLLLNTTTHDFGWTFPVVPRVQIKFLEFIVQAEQPVNMMDIGAGWGFDSICVLFTKNVKTLYALESQKAQCEALKRTVTDSIRINVDKDFPLNGFHAFKKDFLTLAPDFSKGLFHVLNANKVIHFFDPSQSKIFAERVTSLLVKGGRLFLTCLTPSPESMIEKFVNQQTDTTFPGYIFYRLQSKLDASNQKMVEVRKPKVNEIGGYFFQKLVNDNLAETHRVMHYHTKETLEKLLGENFSILETIITTPEENYGTDHMISIVAERQ
jgi:cyclopropane fatty-acyl-phospholipid synthase-like methyltransferase